MKSNKIIVFILFLVILLLFTGYQSEKAQEKPAKKGTLDLSGFNLHHDGNVPLDGEWAFYWDQIIDPGSFDGAEKPTGYYPAPQYWTAYNGLSLPSTGQATYRLIVTTDGAGRLLSLRVPEIYTEYRLWVNGELLAANGGFSGGIVRYLSPGIYDFYTEGTETEIVLQIKNSLHVYAGFGQSLLLGTIKNIHQLHDWNAAIDAILFTICLLSGVYHIILYMFHRRRRELVFFGILCLVVSLRTILSNETLLIQILPTLPFITGSRLVTLTIPVSVISMLLYVRTLYKADMPIGFFKVLLAVNILYAALVLSMPIIFYSNIFIIYLIGVGAACALGFYIMIRAAIKRRQESLYFLVGMSFLVFCACIDILIFVQILHASYMLSIGLAVFICTQSILLIKKYTYTYHHAHHLSEALEESKSRTFNTETAFLGVQIKPHFLYNALNTIADCCRTDPIAAENLILYLSRYLRSTSDLENLGGSITLEKELETVRAYVSIEIARFDNIRLNYDIDAELYGIKLPPLTLQPLVENAIKHGIRKKVASGDITIRMHRRDKTVFCCVEDNGAGMTEEQLQSLLLPRPGSGIGLYNIHTRLLRLYGKGIGIDSAVGIGTCVVFELPWTEEA